MKNLLVASTIFLLFSCIPEEKFPPLEEPTEHLRDVSKAPFYHGVASGDPLADRVIIWTRVTPKEALPSIDVVWEVAEDEGFSNMTKTGTYTTNPERDYTVKIDIEGLDEGSTYYYRFHALGKKSITGRTKTASAYPSEIKLGVISCSNYEWGYFNAYGALALEELDAVVHLGDYIYEYAPGGYGDTTLNRSPIPNKEIVTLQDYRTRYSQYRLDKDLIAAHANHPFINIWDDHEIANDSYKDGAQNHQENEGSYEARKNAARQVFYEWLPIREDDKLYRTFRYGNLADLIMLDERLEGRTAPADSLQDPSLMDSSRSMLGAQQRDWLVAQLRSSEAKWKIIGNQVIFSYLNWGHSSFSINLDSWDGYPVERSIIANAIQKTPVENVIFITGDTHTAWAFEATDDPFTTYNQETGEGAYAIEFGTTSINSANSNERFPDDQVLAHEQKIVNSAINPHLKFTNMRDHGYMILSLTPERAKATWKFMETIKEPSLTIKETNSAEVSDGELKLKVD